MWTRKPLSALQIPHTVQDAVQRHTAGLSQAARDLLVTAAVAGQRVDFDLLQAVTGQPERSLLAQIKELIAAQLLREVESDHFGFRHALTRQAIYQGLLGRERRSLHQALLTALESRATAGESQINDTSTDLSASLAYHAHAAQQWEKSLHYSRQAGEQAQRLFAPRAAAEHFSHAITAADQLPASTLATQGDWAQAQAVLQAAPLAGRSLRAGDGQTASQRLIHCAQAELLLAQGDAAAAQAQVEALIGSVPHTATGAVVPRLWHLRGLALVRLRRLTEAERVFTAGLAAAQEQQLLPLLWRLQLALGDLYHSQRQRELAQACLAAAQTTVNHLAADLPDRHLRQSLLQGFAACLPNAPKPTPLRSAKQAFDGLTAREREVAALVAQGLTNRGIAEQLVVSERTVEKHVENAAGKLGFTSRTQLAVWATERGLHQ